MIKTIQPPWGELYSPLWVELFKSVLKKAQSKSPPPGEMPQAEGVHFQRAPGPVVWSSAFAAAGGIKNCGEAATTTLGPKGRQTYEPSGP